MCCRILFQAFLVIFVTMISVIMPFFLSSYFHFYIFSLPCSPQLQQGICRWGAQCILYLLWFSLLLFLNQGTENSGKRVTYVEYLSFLFFTYSYLHSQWFFLSPTFHSIFSFSVFLFQVAGILFVLGVSLHCRICLPLVIAKA